MYGFLHQDHPHVPRQGPVCEQARLRTSRRRLIELHPGPLPRAQPCFFNGEYDEDLTPENVQSTRNAIMLIESWMACIDSSHRIFKPFKGRVSTLWNDPDIRSHPPAGICRRDNRHCLGSVAGIDRSAGGVPPETLLECDACSLDVKLLESHATIIQAFLAKGEHSIRTTGAGSHLRL